MCIPIRPAIPARRSGQLPAPRFRMLGILAPAKPMLNMNLERAG